MPRRAAKASATSNKVDAVADPPVTKARPKRGHSNHTDDAKLPEKKRSKRENAGGEGDEVVEHDGSWGIEQAMDLRPSRNPHPGLVAKSGVKRTSAEVAAAHAKREAAATEARAAEMKKRNGLALILATEDINVENEERKTVRQRSQLVEGDNEVELINRRPAGSGSDDEAVFIRERRAKSQKRGVLYERKLTRKRRPCMCCNLSDRSIL